MGYDLVDNEASYFIEISNTLRTIKRRDNNRDYRSYEV